MMPEKYAILTCPLCGQQQEEEIPQNSCVPFYKCTGCEEIVSAERSCCVFCDYGDKACPAGHKEVE